MFNIPLLISEPPLNVLPSLAVAVGLNEAIVIQQLHYWLGNPKSGVVREGYKWIFNTYAEWHENFPFWSIRTIQRIFLRLEKDGLIITRQFDQNTWDMKKYYRIDYDRLVRLLDDNLSPSHDDNLSHSSVSESRNVIDTKNTTENTTENTNIPSGSEFCNSEKPGKPQRKKSSQQLSQEPELFESQTTSSTKSQESQQEQPKEQPRLKPYEAILETYQLAGVEAPPKCEIVPLLRPMKEALESNWMPPRIAQAWINAKRYGNREIWSLAYTLRHLTDAEGLKAKQGYKNQSQSELTDDEKRAMARNAVRAAFGGILNAN